MEEGRLEVLLVNAKGIKRRRLIGKPAYYVLLQCGDQVRRSKTTTGYRHEAFWNEKFEFELSISEWKKVTCLKISIMDEEFFKNEGLVGNSLIELGGIISEGCEKGGIELLPSSYNVLLSDHSYKGQIKVAFRFTLMKEASGEKIGHENAGEELEKRSQLSIYATLLRFLDVSSWWKWSSNLLYAKN